MRAEETYRNADNNLNLSRAEVEKTKNISYQRTQFCSDCKAGYAQVLEQTNTHQRDYYNKHLPQVFQVSQCILLGVVYLRYVIFTFSVSYSCLVTPYCCQTLALAVKIQ